MAVVTREVDLTSLVERFLRDNGTQPTPFGNGMRAEIPLSCPTRNCTWPIYDTLGVCSSCTEVSNLLKFNCHTIRLGWLDTNVSLPSADYPNGTACGYFLNETSKDPVLLSGYIVHDVDTPVGIRRAGETLISRTLPLVTVPTRRLLFGGSINYKHIYNRIIDVIIVSSKDAASVHRNETPVAHECMLAWCVKTMQSSYLGGIYQEVVLHNFMNTTSLPVPLSATLQDDGSIINKFDGNVTIRPPGTNEIYGTVNKTALAVVVDFDDIFPSMTVARNSSDTSPILRFGLQHEIPMRQMEPRFNPWLARNNHNITQHMDRLATAMTNAMRSSENKGWISGTAFERENYVSVRFQWLALPLTILGLSFVVLISTIIESSRGQVGIWKNSAIATLLLWPPGRVAAKYHCVYSEGDATDEG